MLAAGFVGERMRVQAVGYFTPTYKKEAARLITSCDKLKLPLYLHPLPDQGSWTANVMAKPAFVLAALNLFKQADGIFYTDADSEFLSIPDWEFFNDCHISCHRFQRTKHHEIEYLTGSMFFANTPTTKNFIADWCQATLGRDYSATPEQDSLKQTILKWDERISWKDLPPALVYIHDDFKTIYPSVKPQIVHYQASRKHRK